MLPRVTIRLGMFLWSIPLLPLIASATFAFRPSYPVHISTLLCLEKPNFDFSQLIRSKKQLPKEALLTEQEISFIDSLVSRRTEARAKGDYVMADVFRKTIDNVSQEGSCSVKIPEGYRIHVKDVPRSEGGGSTWTLLPCIAVESDPLQGQKPEKGSINEATVLELAHFALGLATSSSDKGIAVCEDQLNDIVLRAKRRLKKAGEEELRGRKAADAAFWFALSGVKDDCSIGAAEGLDFSLFDALAYICLAELERYGGKPSCRAMDIMHMVERIAVTGISSEIFQQLQQEAAKCLETKNFHDLKERGVLDELRQGKFDFHSERSLLWIWRFSTRQRKQRNFLKSASEHWERKGNQELSLKKEVPPNDNCTENLPPWSDVYEDPTRPLVLDIGCGMGISLLGLSSMKEVDCDGNGLINLEWPNCNFLGADLSRLGVNFATAMSQRLSLKKNIHFVTCSAEEIVAHVAESYPGKLGLCMIQFPTPFRFNETIDVDQKEIPQSVVNQGNRQLPTDAYNGFMVTQKLMELIRDALDKEHGRLLLQSNVEDVAVFMKMLATECGLEAVLATKFVDKISDDGNVSPQRTQKWVSSGGERAIGNIWSSESFLPSLRCATETEVSCLINRIPVHRVLVKPCG
mmetsp:Transcript_11612/g.21706  ORF Transcript_11612/g.21706 Transcript_11612/m.21706 type:complete len:634 (-) Transcript_11612:43-1944(-)